MSSRAAGYAAGPTLLSRAVSRALGLVLCMALLALAACTARDPEPVPPVENVFEVALEDRREAVALAGETVQGDAVDVRDSRGDVVVLTVWGADCENCRDDMKLVSEIHAGYADRGVTVLGVEVAKERADEGGVAHLRTTFQSLVDQDGRLLLGLGDFSPPALPATLVLDRQGRVAALINGPVPNRNTLTQLIDGALSEGPVRTRTSTNELMREQIAVRAAARRAGVSVAVTRPTRDHSGLVVEVVNEQSKPIRGLDDAAAIQVLDSLLQPAISIPLVYLLHAGAALPR